MTDEETTEGEAEVVPIQPPAAQPSDYDPAQDKGPDRPEDDPSLIPDYVKETPLSAEEL